MIASDEKVLSADSGLDPLVAEVAAKTTNVAQGPQLVGTNARSIKTRSEIFRGNLT
jgi:hypothetical protein